MSLTPIPSRMLHDTAVIKVCNGMDKYQHETFDEYTVTNVHLQADVDVLKRANDTEVQLKGILFIDGRKSQPALDYNQLQEASLKNGAEMRCEVTDAAGNKVGEYAVLIVDGLPDVPAMRTHHWELGLV